MNTYAVVLCYALWFTYQVSADPMPIDRSRFSRQAIEAVNFTGGGAGSGAGTANGTAAGVDPAGNATAAVGVGSIGSAAGGSFLTVTPDGGVSEGSYGTGLGEGGGSAAAGGVNASAGLDTSGVGSGNGSGQSAQLVIIPLPPVNATVPVNATAPVKFVDRAGRFFFPYYGSIGGYAYGGPYGAYSYGGYPYGYYGGYYGLGK